MSKELRVRLRQRYDKAEVWTALNPILEPGEIGIESDTGRFKYGNGTQVWEELEYAFGDGIVSIICQSENDLPAARSYPGAIAIVPQIYEFKKGDLDFLGNKIEADCIMKIDTPYISLRKNNKWYWTIFADQKDKPIASSALDYFQLGVSTLG